MEILLYIGFAISTACALRHYGAVLYYRFSDKVLRSRIAELEKEHSRLSVMYAVNKRLLMAKESDVLDAEYIEESN